MDVQQRLDDIVATVEGARSMPMSASCVVNRADLLDMLGEVREALPGSLAQAQEVLGGREQVVAEAQQEARRIIDEAHRERASLISQTEVARLAEQESDRILTEARRESEEIRVEADDYVDSKLANFEVVLSKTIGAVDRGRDKLLGRAPAPHDGPGGEEFEESPDARAQDPETRKQQAEEYIEAQFRAFEAVLAKTLQAVGRGRQKLTGHQPIDDLAAHMAAQPDAAPDNRLRGTDEEYLAGLVDNSEAAAPTSVRPPAPARPGGGSAGYPAPQPAAYPPQPAAYPPQPCADYTEQPAALPPGAPSPYGHPADRMPPGGTDGQGMPTPDYYAPTGHQDQYAAQGHQDQYAVQSYQDPGYASQHDPYRDPQGYRPEGWPNQYDAPPAYETQGQYGYGDQLGDPSPYGDPGAPHGYQDQGMYAPAPDPYAPQQSGEYYPQPDRHGHGQQHGQGQQHGSPAALDETSFFDTSMIDLEQLRRYEQGRE
ncbi:cell division initiation protein [Streptomyces sp. P38-E01]|uniref:Cell division initiation protein n=1 Tax=Streptomyces tardus TaxID=2780544 RepID=A0A949JCT8_9ACTN|nr:cell division initiation protein [Streptomyces tardus]MBU7596160.1 cell division initiation protein [Streptomyces tardus]